MVGPGPGDGGLGPGLVHGGYGSLRLDDGAGLHGVAQRRRPGACGQGAGVSGLSMMKRDPSWVIWVIQSMRPMGFTYGAVSSRTGCRRGFPSWSTSRWAPQAHTSASMRSGESTGQTGIPQPCVRGRWGQPCSPERWAPPSQHSPGQAGAGSIAEVAWDRPGLGLLRGEWSP